MRVGGGRELLLLTRVQPFAATADANAAMQAALAAVGGLRASRRELTAEHARLHAAAYGNVRLSLNAPGGQRAMAVSELLSRQAAQPDEPLPALLEKLFDSGRYLLLSASGLLPPRLTGLWQGDWNAAWSGAVTTNANLGLQLAGAVTTDVPAAIAALADHVRDRLPDWRENARRLFGCRGITVPRRATGWTAGAGTSRPTTLTSCGPPGPTGSSRCWWRPCTRVRMRRSGCACGPCCGSWPCSTKTS